MAWIIAAAVVIVLLVFRAGYRKSAAGLFGGALVVGVLIYLLVRHQEEQASTELAISEVAVDSVVFSHTFRSSYDLSGTVRNKSERYHIERIRFEVTVRDCLTTEKSSCVVLSTQTAYAAVDVPPEQARNFTASLYFDNELKPKGKLVWDYEIESVKARRQ
jgi:hypothetical protein